MNLSIKEKEKYVLKLREEDKTYRDIAHELLYLSKRNKQNFEKSKW